MERNTVLELFPPCDWYIVNIIKVPSDSMAVFDIHCSAIVKNPDAQGKGISSSSECMNEARRESLLLQ